MIAAQLRDAVPMELTFSIKYDAATLAVIPVTPLTVFSQEQDTRQTIVCAD